jgi:nitric oxide synthase-interacting protein
MFKQCTICNSSLVEPTACTEGHVFCRSCVVEFLVRQKQKIAEGQAETDKILKHQQNAKKEEAIELEVKRLEQFEKYDNFTQITGRQQLVA